MKQAIALAPLVVALSACGGNAPQQGAPASSGASSGPGTVPVTQHRGTPSTLPTADALVPPADGRTAEGASEVVRYYYRLIAVNDLNRAQSMWTGPVRDEDNADFVARFAGDFLKADVGAAYDSEGAAGSIFITVPVTISGHVKAYPEQKFAEKRIFTLRRVNDVPGSSAAQRRWHILSIRDAATPEGQATLAY